MRYLDGQFNEKVLAMGSVSGWDWSAKISTPWTTSQVFSVGGRPQTMAALKNKITMVVNQLDPDMIRSPVFDVRDRAEKVINARGGYIEKK